MLIPCAQRLLWSFWSNPRYLLVANLECFIKLPWVIPAFHYFVWPGWYLFPQYLTWSYCIRILCELSLFGPEELLLLCTLVDYMLASWYAWHFFEYMHDTHIIHFLKFSCAYQEGSSHDRGLYLRSFEELFDLSNSDTTSTSHFNFYITACELYNDQVLILFCQCMLT